MKRAAILILVSLNTAFGWVIEGSVSPHAGVSDTEIVLSYMINESYEGAARLKICLDEYDFNELKYDYDCDILLREVNITMPEPGQEFFTLSAPSWLYRFCLKLYTNYSASPYSDCDNDNTFFLTNSVSAEPMIDQPTLSITAFIPESVEAEQLFTSYVNITNNGFSEIEVLVYSYAYNGSKLVSQGFLNEWKSSWTANQQSILLPAKGTIITSLINRVNEPGVYDFKIRVRLGEQAHDTRKKLLVLDNKQALLMIDSLNYNSTHLTACLTNYGDKEASALLKLFADNTTIDHELLINSKRTIETVFQLNDSTSIHALLLMNNSLVDEASININVLPEPPVIKTETVLYLFTITICLTSLYLLIRKV